MKIMPLEEEIVLKNQSKRIPAGAFVFAALAIMVTAPSAAMAQGFLSYQTVHSPGLEGNLLGDSPNRQVMVYVPPSYTSSQKRYPVVYLLHGFNGANTSWRDGSYQGFNIQTAMNQLIGEGKIQEMMVVMPDGRNAYGGSYFVNSPVIGNWEDFVARDLVKYIDDTYRTLPDASSRAVVGQSMGGYSALYIAIKNADVFSAVYGLSACCLDMVKDVEAGNPEWIPTIQAKDRKGLVQTHFATPSHGNYPHALTALAAGLSPNPDKPPLFVDYPFEIVNGKVRRNESAYNKWLENFPVHMVDKYRSNLLKLKGIRFATGMSDHLQHIPAGNRAFSQALTKAGIPHEFELDSATHGELVREWMETRVLPYFSLILTHQRAVWEAPES